jgi:hypothetical protein
MLEEWSIELDKDFHESYDKVMNAGHYRDLLDEVIQRIDAMNAYVKRPWYKRR